MPSRRTSEAHDASGEPARRRHRSAVVILRLASSPSRLASSPRRLASSPLRSASSPLEDDVASRLRRAARACALVPARSRRARDNGDPHLDGAIAVLRPLDAEHATLGCGRREETPGDAPRPRAVLLHGGDVLLDRVDDPGAMFNGRLRRHVGSVGWGSGHRWAAGPAAFLEPALASGAGSRVGVKLPGAGVAGKAAIARCPLHAWRSWNTCDHFVGLIYWGVTSWTP